jgi:hypothetical protein
VIEGKSDIVAAFISHGRLVSRYTRENPALLPTAAWNEDPTREESVVRSSKGKEMEEPSVRKLGATLYRRIADLILFFLWDQSVPTGDHFMEQLSVDT